MSIKPKTEKNYTHYELVKMIDVQNKETNDKFKKISKEDKVIDAVNKRNASITGKIQNEINGRKKQRKIANYMRTEYLNQYNLKGMPIIKEFNKLLMDNKIKTEKNVDDFFKKNLKKSKSKTTENIKEAIKDIEQKLKCF